MNDEIVRRQYKFLKNKVYNLRNNLTELDGLYNELEALMKQNFLINNDIPYRDSINELKAIKNQIRNEIQNVIIPSINSKI